MAFELGLKEVEFWHLGKVGKGHFMFRNQHEQSLGEQWFKDVAE